MEIGAGDGDSPRLLVGLHARGAQHRRINPGQHFRHICQEAATMADPAPSVLPILIDPVAHYTEASLAANTRWAYRNCIHLFHVQPAQP
jgi:hypothetical protein